ncbi:MAG: ArsA family ATPase [Actinomycetota bacterium]
MSLAEILDAEIVVCAGSGGVGKTTISAAVALEGARRGRKTIVLTIDPARRLGDSLGLKELSSRPHRVPAAQFRRAGLEPAHLDAMMLDTKSTFDELVHRYARDEATADAIVANRFYQAISVALSGTQEYMAMEKLYELANEGRYDLIVIDTPPTRHALDFLEAPKRLTSFLEGRLLKWFLLPAIGGGRGLFKAVNLAAVTFLRLVTKVVGAEVLKDTAEFFTSFEGMYDGFKRRAQEVFDLLRRDTTRFVIVTAPTEQAVKEALFFADTMNSYHLPFGGLVVNRIHPVFDGAGVRSTGAPLIDRLVQIAGEVDQMRAREEHSLERLQGTIDPGHWVRVPFLTREVADLSALADIAQRIFVSPA